MVVHLALAYEADVRIRQADVHTSREGAMIAAVNIKPAFCYRIDYGGHSGVLSGDTRPDENHIRVAMGTDVLFQKVAAAVPALLER